MTFTIKSTAGRGGFAPAEPSFNPNASKNETERLKRELHATADVRTSHVFPPIPTREHDWCAFHDGEEEAGHYGWGRTEAEAISDLIRLDGERADWLQYEQDRKEQQPK